ncbi:hypothetical protein RclHR1_39890001 [Rhizophagus clarus]|uniref:Uncharacterized protein n=1 Tax=Rhizophagus clarus TaxID=94130 RepID=A0A2Z6RI65_9GLOM|nr:hypothetical protein RclHR1_39890001 [Rhizophagus clarus]
MGGLQELGDMFIRDTPEKGKDSPVPVQDNQLLNEFFEAYKEYKEYTSLSGLDLRKAEMKKGFFRGLNQEAKSHPSYEESPDPFKRLSKILVKLDVPHDLRLQILFECKVWHFQGDDDIDLKSRHEAMKAGCSNYTVKTLIDTSSRLRETKIDMEKQGLTIYGDFVPFCEGTDSSESKETNSSNHAGLEQ